MKEPSRFWPFLPDFSSFSQFFPDFSSPFPNFPLFFLIFDIFFAVKAGTLPPSPLYWLRHCFKLSNTTVNTQPLIILISHHKHLTNNFQNPY